MNHHHHHPHHHLRFTGIESDGVGYATGPGSTYYGHHHHHHGPVVSAGRYETDALLHRHQPMDSRRSMIIADYFATTGGGPLGDGVSTTSPSSAAAVTASDGVGDWSYDIGLEHQHPHHRQPNDNCPCPMDCPETVDDYLINSGGSDSVFESDPNRPIPPLSRPALPPPPPPPSALTTTATGADAPVVVGGCPLPVVRTVKRRYTANRKERRRTLSINNAFADLRDCIPNVPADTKLSKIKTLRLATSYIAYLMDILAKDDPSLVVDGEGFKAEVNKKIETREEKKKREMANLSGAIGGGGTEKRAKGRTGWPQHVWALELKQ